MCLLLRGLGSVLCVHLWAGNFWSRRELHLSFPIALSMDPYPVKGLSSVCEVVCINVFHTCACMLILQCGPLLTSHCLTSLGGTVMP